MREPCGHGTPQTTTSLGSSCLYINEGGVGLPTQAHVWSPLSGTRTRSCYFPSRRFGSVVFLVAPIQLFHSRICKEITCPARRVQPPNDIRHRPVALTFCPCLHSTISVCALTIATATRMFSGNSCSDSCGDRSILTPICTPNQLQCIGAELTAIPASYLARPDVQQSCTEIELLFNVITQLPPNGELRSLSKLSILDLSRNDITTIGAALFPPSLTILKFLQNTKLSSIDSRAFEGLSRLATLSLTQTIVTTFPASVFAPLTALISLDLGHNGLLQTFSLDSVFAPYLALLIVSHLTSVPPSEWTKSSTVVLDWITIVYVTHMQVANGDLWRIYSRNLFVFMCKSSSTSASDAKFNVTFTYAAN